MSYLAEFYFLFCSYLEYSQTLKFVKILENIPFAPIIPNTCTQFCKAFPFRERKVHMIHSCLFHNIKLHIQMAILPTGIR